MEARLSRLYSTGPVKAVRLRCEIEASGVSINMRTTQIYNMVFTRYLYFEKVMGIYRYMAHSLSLSSYLGYLALLIWVPFFRSLLRRISFLALRVLYVIILCLLPFVCLLFLGFLFWVPFMATMSFAGYFHVRFLLSAFFDSVRSRFVLV